MTCITEPRFTSCTLKFSLPMKGIYVMIKNMAISQQTERITGVVSEAADALADNLSLHFIYATVRQSRWLDPGDIPPLWQAAVASLHHRDRGVLAKTVGVAQTNLHIPSVGLVRRLPGSELLQARHLGENGVAILKALGQSAERELTLEEVQAAGVNRGGAHLLEIDLRR